jgi:hypothetical protein
MEIKTGDFYKLTIDPSIIVKIVRKDDNKIYSPLGNTIFGVNNSDWREIAYDPEQFLEYWAKISLDDIKFSTVAEFWYFERGLDVPNKNTPEWDSMYEEWAEWAFSNL